MNHNDSRRKFIKLAGVGVGASMLGASNLMAKPIDVKDVKFDEEYDVVVIGTGFAGLAAAAKAAE